MTSTAYNWFYGPPGSTSSLALHMYLIMHCDGFRLKILTSKHFQSSFCLPPSSSLSVQLPQPIKVVPGSDCCAQPGSMQASPISPLFSQSSLCTCYPQLEKLIYLQTLDLLLQLKPGSSNSLKMHLVEPAPTEVPIGASSIAYRSWTSSARQGNQQRKDPLIWLSLHELLL